MVEVVCEERKKELRSIVKYRSIYYARVVAQKRNEEGNIERYTELTSPALSQSNPTSS